MASMIINVVHIKRALLLMMSNSLFPLRLSITLIFHVQGTEGGCAMELLDVTQRELPFAVDVW